MVLPLLGLDSALALQGEGGHKALDLGGLGVGLAGGGLVSAAVGVDILAHVVVLGQVEKLTDL
eukprot:scaffold662600_cov53-Prasinocladus_malaysianus.AAC.1